MSTAARPTILPHGRSPRSRSRRRRDLAARHRLPTIYASDVYQSSGSLVTYGYNNSVMERNAAVIVDRILKGRKAAELPFEQPTQFEMIVNLKTAKSLGLTVPQTVLVRADRVIE